MAWYGNSKAHATAGSLGGKAQGRFSNPGNFANDVEKARRAGRKGGAISTKKSPVTIEDMSFVRQ
jgi:general stress protein YciG